MAAARSARRTVRPRRGIRWDRVARIALLCVAVLMVYLYAGPTSSWIGAYKEAGRKRAEVAELKERNAELRARRNALRRESTLEQEARKLGMVKAGEKAFVVEGLPKR